MYIKMSIQEARTKLHTICTDAQIDSTIKKYGEKVVIRATNYCAKSKDGVTISCMKDALKKFHFEKETLEDIWRQPATVPIDPTKARQLRNAYKPPL